jgi:RNA polymerase sigma factor (sigma-70 family)
MQAQQSSKTTIGSYLTEIGKIAILPKDQQIFHGKRIRKWLDWPGGEDQAPDSIKKLGIRSMNRMVESNLRMVVSVAKKYANQGISLEDLIQEGNLGLMVACRRFDPERGYCFSTFSYWWIRQGITRCLANTSRIIRVPCNVSDLNRKIKKIQMSWLSEKGKLPTNEEIADTLKEPLDKIQLALQATAMQPRSLDQIAIEDGSPLVDLISVTDAISQTEDVEGEVMMDRLMEMIETLPNLERMALEGVAFQRLTHREVANQLELSTTRVGQLYRLAVQRLRERVQLEDSALEEINRPATIKGLTQGHARARICVSSGLAMPQSAHQTQNSSKQKYENVALPA